MKFCKKCNCETDRSLNGDCKVCAIARALAYKNTHPEKVRLSKLTYSKTNAKKIAEAAAKYRKENHEKILNRESVYRKKNKKENSTYAADYYKKNCKELNKKNAEYRENNIQKLAENYKKNKNKRAKYLLLTSAKRSELSSIWRKENVEKCRIYCQNRRARKVFNGGVLSAGLSKKLLALQKGKCACCAKPLNNKYHLDHILPLFLGGENTDANMQLLLPACNLKKHIKHPIDFMQEMGFLL